jgi:radical SAM protein with 4Fe4S-binding SPASM domain
MSERSFGRYSELLERARAAVSERGEVDGAEALRRALRRNPRRLIDVPGRRPRFVVWELTRACNLRCRHCGSGAGRALDDELSPAEALALADDLAALGCERVTLLGGEPLLRPDWPDIAARLRRGGVRVNLITNGWLLSEPRVLDAVAAAGLVNVGLSIDGREATHDTLRRRDGSFRRLLEAARSLRGRGVRPVAVTVATRESLDDLEALHGLLVEVGVGLWQVQLAVPKGRLERESPSVMGPADLLRLARLLDELKARGGLRLDIADNIGYFGGFEERLRRTAKDQIPFWTGCYAGVQVLGIDANGDVKGCASLPSIPAFIEGNVRARPLREIWERPGGFAYNRCFELAQLEEPCRSCEHAPVCRGGCKSAAHGFTGSIASTSMCLSQAGDLGPPPTR